MSPMVSRIGELRELPVQFTKPIRGRTLEARNDWTYIRLAMDKTRRWYRQLSAERIQRNITYCRDLCRASRASDRKHYPQRYDSDSGC